MVNVNMNELNFKLNQEQRRELIKSVAGLLMAHTTSL
jgi:hypothetical protein